VTGGASGLGGAAVDMVVAQGGKAIVLDLKNEEGRAKAAQHGTNARFVKADVTNEDEVLAAVGLALQEFGHLDGLVNAAGIPAAERVLGREGVQPLEHFTRVIQVNLIGTFNVIRLAAAAMSTNTPPGEGGDAA
jgi:NAD(P)-dependent dehydrogenase (short-subunit alcohol dehydrogenase family)